jgi:hypothetical protein
MRREKLRQNRHCCIVGIHFAIILVSDGEPTNSSNAEGTVKIGLDNGTTDIVVVE